MPKNVCFFSVNNVIKYIVICQKINILCYIRAVGFKCDWKDGFTSNHFFSEVPIQNNASSRHITHLK